MKLIFVGSLTSDTSITIRQNLESLICYIADRGEQFVVRASERLRPEVIPIDEVVLETLQTYIADRPSSAPDRSRLTVVREPGSARNHKIAIPHTSYQAATSYRTDFYREILEKVDLVVGVGGELGLLRLAIVCEHASTPVFHLPGTGGTADMLWDEYFQKSAQLRQASPEDVDFLKGTPHADTADEAYAADIYLRFVRVLAMPRRKHPPTTVLTADSISVSAFRQALGRFSLGLWITIIGVLSTLLSVSYSLGANHFIKRLFSDGE